MKRRLLRCTLYIHIFILLSFVVDLQNVAQGQQGQASQVRLVERAPTPQLEAELSRFTRAYAGRVLWNPVSRIPAEISELDARIAPALTEATVDSTVRAFIQTNRDFFGIQPDRMQLFFLNSAEGKFYLKYRQTIDGVPVEGHETGCIVDEDGNLIRYTSNFNPDLRISTQARISEDSARESARQSLGNLGPTAQITEFEKLILPQTVNDRTSYTLAYKIVMFAESLDRNPHQWVCIDADSGEVIYQGDATPWSITGTVRGEIVPDRSTDPRQTLPLKNLTVFALKTSQPMSGTVMSNSTGSNGTYTLTSWPGSWNLLASLSGPYAGVSSVSQAGVIHNQTINHGVTHNWTWSQANSNDLAQINVFYHINRLHDELYKDMIGYSWKNSWTNTNQFLARTGYSFNNAYAGSPMTFGANPHGLNADEIYHECSHNVLYTLFGGWVGYGGTKQHSESEAYAFDEGFADFFSCVMLDRPGVINRNLNNTMDYPANYTINTGQGLEGHTGGQIIAGAAWDLRGMMQTKLGNNLGARYNAKLIFKGLMTLAGDPKPYRFSMPGTSNFLDALLRAADNNNKVSDGTPWDREIFQAFRNHGMLPVDVYIADRTGDTGDVPSNPNGEPCWVSPDIYIDAPPFAGSSGAVAYEVPKHNAQNQVRVRVRNSGYLTAKKVKVTLYALNMLANVGTKTWKKVGAVDVTNIAPNSNKISNPINWTYHTGERLRAELTTPDDMITEPNSVPLENNIAQRNVMVYIAYAGDKLNMPYYYWLFNKKWLDELKPELKSSDKNTFSIDLIQENVPDNAAVQLNLPDDIRARLTQPVMPVSRQAEMTPSSVQIVKPIESVDRRDDLIQERKDKAIKALDKAFAPTGESQVSDATETAATGDYYGDLERDLSKIAMEIESYKDLPLVPDIETPMSLSFQVPKNSRAGDVYTFHVAIRLGDEVVDGMTYEIHVQDRSREDTNKLRERLRVR